MNLLDLRQLIQDDLLCLLDNFAREIQVSACQIVVDRFKEYDEENRKE